MEDGGWRFEARGEGNFQMSKGKGSLRLEVRGLRRNEKIQIPNNK